MIIVPLPKELNGLMLENELVAAGLPAGTSVLASGEELHINAPVEHSDLAKKVISAHKPPAPPESTADKKSRLETALSSATTIDEVKAVIYELLPK